MDPNKNQKLEEAGFKCKKCDFYSPLGRGLEVNKDFNVVLCSICNLFSPKDKNDFNFYLSEKIDWHTLETFRKYNVNRFSHENQKNGMIEKSKSGKVMSRPPFGYKVINSELIPDENSENVRLIFEDFASGKSLNQVAKIYNISVNGIKKILKNFAYIGKVKFADQISQGTHKPLISSELFNRVQKIFECK